MTTKELITANIIQDITKSGRITYFDDIVTRIYNWLHSLGFEVACNQYTLTDDTYRRVYNHPKYGTLSVKLDRSSVRGDIVNLVNFVTNMEEPPATQPQQTTDQPINPPFNFTPISKEDLNQLCSEYDEPLNIRKQCINKEYIDNAVNDLAKVVTSLGRLIDWLNACGYTTQVNSENSYEFIYVTIKSPHSDNNCTYKYTDLHDIFRYVIIEDHVHIVAFRIAKFFADNIVDRTKANISFDEFAAQYGWKHQFLTDEDDNKWGWVKNGILYPLPYRSGEYMDNYKHVIHEIVGHVQCEELRLV